MTPLYTQEEYDNGNSTTLLPLQCIICENTFYKHKKRIKFDLKNNPNGSNFCSKRCQTINRNGFKKQIVNCLNCSTEFEKLPNQIKTTPNHFCTSSCAATYNNKHKTTGTRRSKLEVYLEEQLSLLFPYITIDYNKKSIINSELDIYIPSLRLAFELNGIFHYEPIYGSNKLNQIQNNDISKSKACFDNQIDLCTIDVSGLKYFKPCNAQKYLDIIVNIINQRTSLLTS